MPIEHCCVEGCKSRKPAVKLYNLPANDGLREIWLKYLIPKSPSLQNLAKEVLVSKKVCKLHFEPKYLTGCGKRKRLACPTLFTDEEINKQQPSTPVKISFEHMEEDHSYCLGLGSSESIPVSGLHQLSKYEITDIKWGVKYIKDDHTYSLNSRNNIVVKPYETGSTDYTLPDAVDENSRYSSSDCPEPGMLTDEPEVAIEPLREEYPFSWQKLTEDIETLYEEHPADDDVMFCNTVQLVPDVSEPASQTRWEYSCDVCQERITGFRYACVQCWGAALCGACEARGQHAAHYVLRVPRHANHSEAQAALAALRRALADCSAQPRSPEIKEEVKNEDPLAEVEASTEVIAQSYVESFEDIQASSEVHALSDVVCFEDTQMEEEYLELDSSFNAGSDTDSVIHIAPTEPEKRKTPEDADIQNVPPNKRKCVRDGTEKSSALMLNETSVQKNSSFVDDDTISLVQTSNEDRIVNAVNEDRMEHAITTFSHEHRDETSDTQFLLELFGAGSSREVFVSLKKLSEDEILTATRPARGKR